MSFNLDDPLAGILSDGSDDSFFDDDILGKKKPVKKSSTPTIEKKNALFDLDDGPKIKKTDDVTKDIFGTSSKTEVAVDSNTASKKEEVKPTTPSPFKSTVAKEATKTQIERTDFSRSPAKSKLTTSGNKLDLLDDLGVEPRKEITKPLEKGKSSQSILDDILGGPTKPAVVKRPKTAIKKDDFDLDSILGKSESKQSVMSNKNITQTLPKMDTPKEPPSKKKSSDDWLGAFQEKDEIEAEDDIDMPSWLVGGGAKKKKSSNVSKSEPKTETIKEAPKSDIENAGDKHKEETEDKIENAPQPIVSKIDIPSTSKLDATNENVTMEGAALYLQQQESQIMVALQLKAQDEKLAAMQVRQKESQRVQREAARAQREQLDALLRRQADQRHQMQAVIAAHQERITDRIKSLLGTSNEDQQGEVNLDADYENPVEERDTPFSREKKQLLQLVRSLQENHDKEIDLMETSYRRQLAFIEVSFNQAEERMKEESDKLVKFYTEKINWLDEHHQQYKKLTNDNMSSLMERHKAENEMLRQQHLENVKVLQEHHTALMENIKNAVKQEQVLVKDSAGFSSDLQELLNDVKDNKSQCQELVQKIEALTQNTQQNTDRSVQMIEEESAALKQKKMEFEFEKATFSKQTEFAKNILKKQDEEIKMLKEDIQKEYQEKIAKIDEEKAKAFKDSAIVAKEKASVQSLKLDLEKTRAELQAQLEEVTAERSKLNVEKQELHMEEQRVLAKSRDLDLLAKTAIDKQAQAEKKHSDAEFAQHKYEERIRRIQEHVVSLNAREKQIAKEKVALSRERLSMHNERKQLESRQQCSLCRNTQYNDHTYNLPDTYMNPTVSRDYNAMPLNIVEQELAHLMGRTFKLRHSAEVNATFEDRQVDASEFDSVPAQAESGAFKDYLDPKFMMLRLDVQQVISNLDQSKKEDTERNEDHE
ncbi:uncharacterized protein [Epargyreus clarus]|uniref:uncharacterized protein isoform X2 n=1 Tax=Epargyreus clarus TaxID=520877 RepID=UPI003C2F7255